MNRRTVTPHHPVRLTMPVRRRYCCSCCSQILQPWMTMMKSWRGCLAHLTIWLLVMSARSDLYWNWYAHWRSNDTAWHRDRTAASRLIHKVNSELINSQDFPHFLTLTSWKLCGKWETDDGREVDFMWIVSERCFSAVYLSKLQLSK